MKKSSLIWIVSTFSILSLLDAAIGETLVPPQKTSDLLARGKKVYEQNCSPCHGTKGDGKGPAGALLKPPPSVFTIPLKEWPITKGNLNKVFEVISKGIPNSAMIKWDQLSERERWALAYTVVGFAAAPEKKTK